MYTTYMRALNLINSDIALAIVTKEALKKGYDVSIPFSEGTEFDAILSKGNRHITTQVKKCYINTHRNNVLTIPVTKQSNNRRTRTVRLAYENIDFIVGVDTLTDNCWIIPFKEVLGFKSNMSLGSKYERYRNNWNL